MTCYARTFLTGGLKILVKNPGKAQISKPKLGLEIFQKIGKNS